MEEMDNQIEQATSMLSKNRKVLLSVLAVVVIVGALFLLIPRKQNTAVKDLNLDSQLKQTLYFVYLPCFLRCSARRCCSCII
jgi:uncharacterized protein involved in exopolysaccharide biosynthesis